MQSTEDNSTNPDEENADDFPSTEKRRKPSSSDDTREREQALFVDLKTKHRSSYSGHQYRLWAEAIVSRCHASFGRQTNSKTQY